MDGAATTTGVAGKFEPKRMVLVAYFAFALAGGMFLSRVFAAIFSAARVNDPQLFGDVSLSGLIGFAVAIAAVLVCFFNPRIHAGSLDVAAELTRVTWPSLAETRVSTIAVIVASLVAAAILFGFDFVSSKVMTQWVPSLLGLLTRL